MMLKRAFNALLGIEPPPETRDDPHFKSDLWPQMAPPRPTRKPRAAMTPALREARRIISELTAALEEEVVASKTARNDYIKLAAAINKNAKNVAIAERILMDNDILVAMAACNTDDPKVGLKHLSSISGELSSRHVEQLGYIAKRIQQCREAKPKSQENTNVIS